MEGVTIQTFEGHIKMILIELEEKKTEYEGNINDPVVNPKMENTDYFRGKADAYQYASKQIRECLKWHGKIS